MRKFVLLVLGAGGILGLIAFFWGSAQDELATYPHAYIQEPGYDPEAIITVLGPFATPAHAPPGYQLAWQCDDPAFNDPVGRPWLFPMPLGDVVAQPPVHPQLRRHPTMDSCHPYRTPEAQAMLVRFAQGHQP